MTDHLPICLAVTDHFIALFLLYPISCCFWRGSWDLLGFYVYPAREPLCYWVMAAAGSCTVFNYILVPGLQGCLNRGKHLYVIVSRLFLYYHALLYMSFWRGVWELYNFYIGKDWRWSLLHLCGSLALLISLKVLRTTMWPPVHISMDTRPNLLRASNRFKVNPSRTLLYIGDCFFSAIAIECLTILTWRSVWNVMDAMVFPENWFKSDIACLTFGATGILMLFTFQSCLAKVSLRLSNSSHFCRLAWEDAWCLVTFCFLTPLWRGGWNLNKIYFIQELPLGAWVNHFLGTSLMLFSQTFSCMASFGVSIDGEIPPGSSFFATRYLRYYLYAPANDELSLADNETVVTADTEDQDSEPDADEHTPILSNDPSPHQSCSINSNRILQT